jgi:hypothetical protein
MSSVLCTRLLCRIKYEEKISIILKLFNIYIYMHACSKSIYQPQLCACNLGLCLYCNTLECDFNTHECDFHTHECDLQTLECDFHTHECDLHTLECDFNTRACDFHTRACDLDKNFNFEKLNQILALNYKLTEIIAK